MTRYRLTVAVLLFLTFMSMAAMIKGMEALSITATTGIMTVLGTYIWGQTKRPSRSIIDEEIRKRGLEHNKEQDDKE